MNKFAAAKFGLFLLLLVWSPQFTGAQTSKQPILHIASQTRERDAIDETARLAQEIINHSFPELVNARISVKAFSSSSDYFRSRFSISRFITFRPMHYIIFVNPTIFDKSAPPAAIRAIIAHELAHAAYYRRHHRIELIGLVWLAAKSFRARFERGADLVAIGRGYGEGLKAYRQWLYQNISAKKIAAKRRDYFSPDEIDLILQTIRIKPTLINYWMKNIPRNLKEIEKDAKSR